MAEFVNLYSPSIDIQKLHHIVIGLDDTAHHDDFLQIPNF